MEASSTWQTAVSTQLPLLSRPQAAVLAAWSFATVCLQHCGRTRCAAFLAALLAQREAAVEQRLREWYCEAPAKKGPARQALVVTACFRPLLAWVLAQWPATNRHLALALDVTYLGGRFLVLAVSVVYNGTAVPVAWAVLPGQDKGAWHPHWVQLLTHLAPAVPEVWTVLVLADRGLYSPRLFQVVRELGWHPFFRIRAQGRYQRARGGPWRDLGTVVRQPGQRWAGRVRCFRNPEGQLVGTLLAHWTAPHTEAWLVLTDLAPAAADVAWYGLRAWIERGFKDLKRGGWHWEQTKLQDAARVERYWLMLAVAQLYALLLEAGPARTPPSAWEQLPPTHIARRTRQHACPRRRLSVQTRGVIQGLVRLLRGAVPPLGRLQPAPWPGEPPVFAALQAVLQPRPAALVGQHSRKT